MADPQSLTAGAGATVVTLSGSILGIQYDALTIGLLGGVAALMHLPPMPGHLHKFGSVMLASLVGGLFAPVASATALNYAGWLHDVGDVPLRLGCAFILGLVSQVAIPVVLDMIKRKGEQV